MHRWISVCFALFALAAPAAEPPAPTFTAETNLVRVDFEVTHNGAPAGPFEAADLVVRDNGAIQPIRAVSQGQLPLDLVLLFDVSGSMDSFVEQVAATAEHALAELREGDRVAVMTFNDSTRLLLPLTSDLARVARVVRERVVGGDFDGGTALLAGVDDAARYLLSTSRGANRRAVITITDNDGQRSRRESTVMSNLWEADATLHGLVMTSRSQTAWRWYFRIMAPYAEFFVTEGIGGAVSKTGGVMIAARNAADAFPELVRRIRARPALYYTMPPGAEGEFREIKVELAAAARRAHPKARIYARRGYHVPGRPQVEIASAGRLPEGLINDVETDEDVDDDWDDDDDDDTEWLVIFSREEEEEEEEIVCIPCKPPVSRR
jgi:VWFA-related protein